MAEGVRRITETALPGVGVRFAFELSNGRAVSVVVRRDGRRELYVESEADPDASRLLLSMDDADSRALAELLGGSEVVRELEGLQGRFQGLILEWLTIAAGSRAVGHSIGGLRVRRVTGGTIVGVVRGDRTFPNPGPDQVLEAGDTVVVVGSRDSVAAISDLFDGA